MATVSKTTATKLIQQVLREFYLTTIQEWVNKMNENEYHSREESVEDLIQNLAIDYVLEEPGWHPHVNMSRHDVYTLTQVEWGKPTKSWCSWDGSTEANPKIEDITHPLERSNKPKLILWGPKIYLSGYGRYEGLEIAQKLRDLYK